MTEALKKELSAFDSVCIVLGSVIGSGIFVSPHRVFELVDGSISLSLLAWFFAALVSLAGAFCYAELGCLFPRSGAEYQYLKNGLGDFWGFLFSWCQLLVLGTGSIAIMALVSANYFVGALGQSWPLPGQLTASILIALLTVVNCFGIRSGSLIQNSFTAVKVLGILALLILGLANLGNLNFDSFFSPAPAKNLTNPATFGAAMIACLWAYDGWNNLSRITEESKNINRNLPLGLLIGVGLAAAVYLSLNVLYLSALSAGELTGSETIAITLVDKLTSSWGGPVALIVGLFIAFSSAGATNGSLLSGARIYFGAARDGLFFKKLSEVSASSKVPVNALLIQALWAITLIWLGENFETLLGYFSFSAWIFYALSAIILIKLRLQQPQLERTFKVPFYPVLPLLFLAGALYLITSQFIQSPIQSLLSLLVFVIGSILYFIFIRKKV
jgi:L-type amino acid transporter 9